VIHQVRRFIEAVANLPGGYQDAGKPCPFRKGCDILNLLSLISPVIDTYSAALRLSFICAAITAACALLLVIWTRLPRLSRKDERVAQEE
jgi:hypothetical protein